MVHRCPALSLLVLTNHGEPPFLAAFDGLEAVPEPQPSLPVVRVPVDERGQSAKVDVVHAVPDVVTLQVAHPVPDLPPTVFLGNAPILAMASEPGLLTARVDVPPDQTSIIRIRDAGASADSCVVSLRHAPDEVEGMRRLIEASEIPPMVTRDRDTGSVESMELMLWTDGTATRRRVDRFLDRYGAALGVPREQLRPTWHHVGRDGSEELAFEQRVGELSVWGADLVLRFDRRGALRTIRSGLYPVVDAPVFHRDAPTLFAVASERIGAIHAAEPVIYAGARVRSGGMRRPQAGYWIRGADGAVLVDDVSGHPILDVKTLAGGARAGLASLALRS